MGLDRETSIAILNEAREAGFEDQPQPEDDDALIERATYFYKLAKEEVEDPTLPFEARNVANMIIFMGDTGMIDAAPRNGDDAARDALGVPRSKVKDTYPRRSSGGLSESDERETDNITGLGSDFAEREHLPIPAHIEGDPDPLPRNLLDLTDKQVRKLSGEYNAYLARATYLLAVESSDLANAEHLLENAKGEALREMNIMDADGKKQKLAKVIEAELLAYPEVKKYNQAVSKHQQQVIILKALKEIYSGNIDRLSRDWTMRQNEWEKSR